jgi:hypothetical protein
MQIFGLDRDPAAAARALGDRHVVKMTLESTQILSTVASLAGDVTRYRPTHHNHPCTRWVRDSGGHWHWLLAHARALAGEYEFRYDRRHACLDVIDELSAREVSDTRVTPAAVVFTTLSLDEKYRFYSDLYAHRLSYLREKRHMHVYARGRPAPLWLQSENLLSGE